MRSLDVVKFRMDADRRPEGVAMSWSRIGGLIVSRSIMSME